MQPKMWLPAEVESALFSSLLQSRTCPEKQFAHALLKGGVTSVDLSESFWTNSGKDIDGLVLHHNSLITHGGKRIKYSRNSVNAAKLPVLWALFERLGVGYSGMADSETGYAQACPSSRTSPLTVTRFANMNFPLVVLYFNAMKGLPDYHRDEKKA